MSKERPILFSGPMVRAILEGRKTQTRRVVKPQPNHGVNSCHYSETGWAETDASGNGCQCNKEVRCPYGVAGDKLWVRETWCNYPLAGVDCTPGLIYRATNDCVPRGMWKPSIHMPRWASRLTLEVTGVRVERLQDISEEDAVAEGIEFRPGAYGNGKIWKYYGWLEKHDQWSSSPVRSFESLWGSINGADSWAANPWVWVVEFTKAKGVENERT